MHDDCRSSRRRQMAQCLNHFASFGIGRVACYDVALLDCCDFFPSHCKANHQMTSIRWMGLHGAMAEGIRTRWLSRFVIKKVVRSAYLDVVLATQHQPQQPLLHSKH